MNRERANEILSAFGRPVIQVGSTALQFARQDQHDIEEIEQMETEALVRHWKNMVWLNYIYGQSSLSDLQRISLVEAEMEERGVNADELSEWVEQAQREFDEQGV
jgi:hypothetical protein